MFRRPVKKHEDCDCDKNLKKYLHFLESWCIMASAVTLIARKREVATWVNLFTGGFSVERMSRDSGGGLGHTVVEESVNLTASHCTNHICVCEKR